ncbi:MAG TPA: cysteine desulfurase family protein [Candidatus Saccharimonadales bacterium]|nr:cysteine desulfurase family protein [Candidatus Saccharimonadales bacterium]
MSTQPIYLDYAAATPLHPEVLSVMQPFLTDKFYNPSAAYMAARGIRADIETARAQIGHMLGSRSNELIFTAGATESIDLAINGVMGHYPDGHIVTSAIEHAAVLATASSQPHFTILGVDHHGLVDLDDIKAAITYQTTLISIGYVNNEIGTVQHLSDISRLIKLIRRERQANNNSRPLYLHTDASQAAGHLDLHVSRLGVDLMTLNAAKVYGPKQVGLLYSNSQVQLTPQLRGGGQENGQRSGTENVAGIIGLAKALEIAETAREADMKHLNGLRDHCTGRLLSALPDTMVNGHPKRHTPHILNLSFQGVDGERLLMELDEAGVMVATGSACAANLDQRSHVLQALGLANDLIDGSLRLSFGPQTTTEQIDVALDHLIQLVSTQRGK